MSTKQGILIDFTSDENISNYDNENSLDEAYLMYGVSRVREKEMKDDISISSDESEMLKERRNSKLFIVRAAADGKVLSQFPIDEVDSIASLLVERNSMTRAPCMRFLSMMQPLAEEVPERDEEWLRQCMRGILFSAINVETQEESSNLSEAKLPLGPEGVYCWFVENKCNDKDMWSFYHCLKRLAKTHDAEACILYRILNDDNLDSAEIFVDTLVYIHSLMDDQSFHEQFDLNGDCPKRIWMSRDLTRQVIDHAFKWIDPPLAIEDLLQRVDSEIENESNCVDLFAFLQMLMQVHNDQIELQTTLIRAKIEAITMEDEDFDVDKKALVSITELRQILISVNNDITLRETALLYQDAYDFLTAHGTNGLVPRGITFDSFLFAAKRRGLLTSIRRSYYLSTNEDTAREGI